jgi:hypothetical protein
MHSYTTSKPFSTKKPVRFGQSPQETLHTLKQTLVPQATNFFKWCEKHPIGALVLQDVTCFNIPTMALARSKNELLDGIPNMVGLTSVTAGSSIFVPPLLRKLTAKLTHIPEAHLKAPLTEARLLEMPMSEKLGRLSASLGFLFPFGAGFMAVPFFRNVLTLQRAGTSDFEKIIGLRKPHAQTPEASQAHTTTAPSTKSPEFYAARKKYLQGGLRILAGGIGLGAISLLGFAHLARNVVKGRMTIAPHSFADTLIHQLTKTFALRGHTSNAVSGLWSVLIFWLATPYLGWHLAARSRNEKIENIVKATNSMLWFSMFTPMFLKGRFAKKFEALGYTTGASHIKNPILKGIRADLPSYHAVSQLQNPLQKEAYTRLLNRYHFVSWVLPIVALSTTPQLINIFFTKRRFQKTEATGSPIPPTTPLHVTPVTLIAVSKVHPAPLLHPPSI